MHFFTSAYNVFTGNFMTHYPKLKEPDYGHKIVDSPDIFVGHTSNVSSNLYNAIFWYRTPILDQKPIQSDFSHTLNEILETKKANLRLKKWFPNLFYECMYKALLEEKFELISTWEPQLFEKCSEKSVKSGFGNLDTVKCLELVQASQFLAFDSPQLYNLYAL